MDGTTPKPAWGTSEVRGNCVQMGPQQQCSGDVPGTRAPVGWLENWMFNDVYICLPMYRWSLKCGANAWFMIQ